MQAISPTLLAACNAAGQRVCMAVEVSWSDTGLITAARGGTGWTDESAYLMRHSGKLIINPPGERLVAAGSVGTATVVLSNTDHRFSWKRADGPLYAHIGGAAGLAGKPLRIYQGYVTAGVAEYVRIFTGVIETWDENIAEGTIELSCRDWGFRYLQDKRSTAVATDKLASEWITIVAGLASITAPLLDLDVGIFPIPWCWMDDESIVEEIWQAAEADGGLAWFDQNGLLVYHNSLAWTNLTSVWTFAENTYSLSEPSNPVDALATKIKVEWSGRLAGPDTTLYTLDSYKVILPGHTETWVARFNHATTAVRTPDSADPYNDYFAVSGGGLDMTDKITVTLADIYGQQCSVSVENTSTTQAARLVAFKIRGQPLLGGPTEQVELAISPAPLSYERVRSERGNAYCQSANQGNALASLLVLRGGRVRSLYALRNVPGLPHLELADLATFVNTRALGSGQSVTGLIIGIAWDTGQGGFLQQYVLMDVTDLAAYTNYFVIGASQLGAHDRLFY